MEVPNVHKPSFVNNPEKALRDLAGIPPATGSPFISMVDKIESARDLWHERYGPLSPITKPSTYLPVWEETFKAPDRLKRVIHLDFAYSEDGDSFGFAMGHVPEVVKREGELKPFITFDCLVRIHAPAGRQVVLSDVRQMVYHLRDDRGFRIVHATMDGFQSTDTMQQFPRRRIFAEYLSVDRQRNPYEDLREAIYENRIAFPRYEVRYRFDDVELTEIAVKELMELSDEGLKIDHPENGSKDVADSMAGVVYTLMGQRSYHRRSTVAEAMMGPSEQQGPTEEYQDGRTIIHHPAVMSDDPLSAPIPPQGATTDFWNPRSPRRF